jgi:hypothetical protein
MKNITRKEYMKNSSELFDAYYGQFINHSTEMFVLGQIGIEKLKSSKDEHFNDIIKHSNGGAGGWIWDHTPFNLELAYELGEVTRGYLAAPSTHTCIGKTAARRLLNNLKA